MLDSTGDGMHAMQKPMLMCRRYVHGAPSHARHAFLLALSKTTRLDLMHGTRTYAPTTHVRTCSYLRVLLTPYRPSCY
jgi:hypothetical protein